MHVMQECKCTREKNGIHFCTSQFAFKRGRMTDVSDRGASHRSEGSHGGFSAYLVSQLVQVMVLHMQISKQKKVMWSEFTWCAVTTMKTSVLLCFN